MCGRPCGFTGKPLHFVSLRHAINDTTTNERTNERRGRSQRGGARLKVLQRIAWIHSWREVIAPRDSVPLRCTERTLFSAPSPFFPPLFNHSRYLSLRRHRQRLRAPRTTSNPPLPVWVPLGSHPFHTPRGTSNEQFHYCLTPVINLHEYPLPRFLSVPLFSPTTLHLPLLHPSFSSSLSLSLSLSLLFLYNLSFHHLPRSSQRFLFAATLREELSPSSLHRHVSVSTFLFFSPTTLLPRLLLAPEHGSTPFRVCVRVAATGRSSGHRRGQGEKGTRNVHFCSLAA